METEIQKFMKNNRITQAQLMKESGVKQSTLSHFLTTEFMDTTAIRVLVGLGIILDKSTGDVFDDLLEQYNVNTLEALQKQLEEKKNGNGNN